MIGNGFYKLARRLLLGKESHLKRKLEQCESPIEKKLLRVLIERFPRLIIQPQKMIKGFRVDFVIPKYLVVIEADGFEYHSSKSAMARDYVRQRVLMAAGWLVIRFTGSEINADPVSCAQDVGRILATRDAAKLPPPVKTGKLRQSMRPSHRPPERAPRGILDNPPPPDFTPDYGPPSRPKPDFTTGRPKRRRRWWNIF